MRHESVGHVGQRTITSRLGLAVGLVTCALLGFVPAAANAASAIGVSTSFPAIVAIGQSGVSAQIVVTNQNSAPDGSTTIAAAGTAITLTPACGMPDPLAVSGCSPAGADPNVFAVTGATGAAGCAGRAFTVSSFDPAFGTVRVAPTTDLVLSAGASCTIGLTFSVSNLPVFDTDTQVAGFQTAQHVTATAVSDMGGPASASSAGAGTTTVTLAAPTGLATVPATSTGSRSDDNAPEVTGTAPAGAEQVFVYPTANCTGTPVVGTAASFATPGITVFVADNTTTTFSANADDSEDGLSACSTTVTYFEKTTVPSPTPTGTAPASPANNNAPRVTGTAPAGSTVRLYSDSACTVLAAQGSAADFVSPGLTVAVPDNTTTLFFAKAETVADGLSTCSTLWTTYVEDSTPPSALPPGGTLPGSPANDNAPRITGAAPAGVTIRVYTNAACTGAVAATGTPAALQSPGLALSVPDNSTTTFYTTATDDAGNESACSSPGIVYVEDSAPPETVIDSGPSGAGASSTPTFTFSSNEAGARFECRIDIAAFAACRSPFTAATLANGPHTFDVRAIDLVGHVDPTAARRTFTVGGSVAPPADTAPPTRECAGISGLAYIGTSRNDTRSGASGTDHMSGLGGNDLLRGMAGRDCLYGGNGNDRLLGGSGNDRLFGEKGNDQLDGGVGRDNLQGGPGRDRITDRRGLDRFSGGAGNDRIDARDTAQKDRRASDRILCGPGRDTVLVDPRDKIARDCEIRRVTRR